MAEPEDLILEFAHRGVIAAERFWLRYHVGADATRQTLAGLRPHVELLLAALTDQSVGVRPADPPAPASWVARLARRSPRHLRGVPPFNGHRRRRDSHPADPSSIAPRRGTHARRGLPPPGSGAHRTPPAWHVQSRAGQPGDS